MSTQFINKDGQPEWAVLPYQSYLELVQDAQLWREYQMGGSVTRLQQTETEQLARQTARLGAIEHILAQLPHGPKRPQLAHLSDEVVARLSLAVLKPEEVNKLSHLKAIETSPNFEMVISYMANEEQLATSNPLTPHLSCFFAYQDGVYTIYELPPLSLEESLPDDEPTDEEMTAWSLGFSA